MRRLWRVTAMALMASVLAVGGVSAQDNPDGFPEPEMVVIAGSMQDEAGDDTKVLAVPIEKLTSLYRHIESPRDVPEARLAAIAHFFEHYKDLERGKWVKVKGWLGPSEAKKEILDGVKRYKKEMTPKKVRR